MNLRHHSQLEQEIAPTSSASGLSSVAVLQPQPVRPAPILNTTSGIATNASSSMGVDGISNPLVNISNTSSTFTVPSNTTCLSASSMSQTSFGGGFLEGNSSIKTDQVSRAREKITIYLSSIYSVSQNDCLT